MDTMEAIPPGQVEGQGGGDLTPELVRKRRGQLRIIADRFVRNRVAVTGVVVLAIMFLLVLLAPVILHFTLPNNPHPDTQTDIINALAPPSPQHPLGTDEDGRDELARLLYGARVSLLVGFVSMLAALVLGVGIGALAGFYGRWVDSVLMRVVDVVLSIPYLLVLFVVSATYSDGSVRAIVLIIAAITWAGTARVVRGEFLSVKEREFVLAARTLGAGDVRMILRHVLPNAAGPIIVSATLAIGNNIILESVLSFFGFGLQPPAASWGVMLDSGRDSFITQPILVYAPGVAILITVLCFNLMGDGLRDALDPYMTER